MKRRLPYNVQQHIKITVYRKIIKMNHWIKHENMYNKLEVTLHYKVKRHKNTLKNESQGKKTRLYRSSNEHNRKNSVVITDISELAYRICRSRLFLKKKNKGVK